MKHDEEALQDLKDSMQVVGQIYSVIICKQHPDRILAGRHRKASGTKNTYAMDVDERAKLFEITHEEMEQLLIIHSNVQRTVSKEERREELLAYAKILESQGMPKEEIASKIAENVTFTHQYVLELLPSEYKQKEKAVSPGRPTIPVKPSLTESSTSEPETNENFNKSKVKLAPVNTSPRQSDNVKSSYTDAEICLINHLGKAGVKYNTQVPYERPGEFNSEGKPKSYIIDVLTDEDHLGLEVEGPGTSSDNPVRDQFFKERGITIVHLPNAMVLDYGDVVALITKDK